MNAIKRVFVGLFAITLLMYGGYKIYKWKTADSEPPKISCSTDTIAVSVDASEEELLKGVTALDDKDGDVTSSLIVESLSKFLGNNKRTITYAAFDSANNVSKLTRELTYTDYYAPRLSLTAPLRYSYGSLINILNNIKAYDCVDGDITDKVKVTFDTPTAPGTYTATYKVTNSSGDTSYLTAEVQVYQSDRTTLSNTPVISLTDYVVYLEEGEEFNPYSYLKEVTIGSHKYSINNTEGGSNISPSNIKVYGAIDTKKPGTYTITYSFTANGLEGTVDLIAIVE